MSRRGYAIALVAAVVMLVGSMGLTALALATHRPGAVTVRSGVFGGGWGPGMMNQGPDGADEISPTQAQQIASDWLAANQPGAQLGSAYQMPRGYVFPVTRNGVRVGTLVVGDVDGRVAYRQFAPARPTPAPTATS